MDPLADPPVDPEAARRAATEILTQQEYRPRQPSLLVRALRWLFDHLSPPRPSGGGSPGTAPGPISTVISWVVWLALVALALFALFRVAKALRARGWGRSRRAEDDDETVTELDAPSAPASWDAEAAAHEAAGRWRDAVMARYRATVGRLMAIGVASTRPGSSTGDFRRQVDAALPAAAPPFADLTDIFDDVRYGGVNADAELGEFARHRAQAVVALADAAGAVRADQRDRPDHDGPDDDGPDDDGPGDDGPGDDGPGGHGPGDTDDTDGDGRAGPSRGRRRGRR